MAAFMLGLNLKLSLHLLVHSERARARNKQAWRKRQDCRPRLHLFYQEETEQVGLPGKDVARTSDLHSGDGGDHDGRSEGNR